MAKPRECVIRLSASDLKTTHFFRFFTEFSQVQNYSLRKNMNLNQILRGVAQNCIQQYPSLREAAESLSIDTRTLQRYAQWKESGD